MQKENPSEIPESKIPLLTFAIELIKFRPFTFLWNVIGSLIFFLTPVFLGLTVREIFNKLQGHSTTNLQLWLLIALIPLIYLIQTIIDVLNVYSDWRFVASSQILLRSNLLSGVLSQPGATAIKGSSGENISKFRGDVSEISWFTNFLAILTSFTIFSIVSTTILLSINVKITLFAYIPFIFVILFVRYSRPKIQELRRERRSAAGRVTGAVSEIFGSIQAIKVANAERNTGKHFQELNQIRQKAAIKDSVFTTIIRTVGLVIVAFSTAVILLLVANEMRAGNFTIGDFILFTMLLNWLQGYIRDISEAIAWYQRGQVSYSRMYSVMKGQKQTNDFSDLNDLVKHHEIYLTKQYEQTTLKDTPNSKLEVLSVNNLSYKFDNSEAGIFDISFSLPKKSFTVITGKIGSGKTTLLQVLIGLRIKSQGIIKWNGKEIKDPTKFFVPPISSYTPQVPRLFSETVQENILLGIEDENDDIEKAIRLAVVEEDIATLDDKLNTMIGPKGVKLSGGQKQRIAAARMFIRGGELIIVDDLSSALDVETENLLWERIFKETESTFLIVSHRKSAMRKADNIILLKNGRILNQGTLDFLLNSEDEMKEIWSGKLDDEEKIVEEVK